MNARRRLPYGYLWASVILTAAAFPASGLLGLGLGLAGIVCGSVFVVRAGR